MKRHILALTVVAITGIACAHYPQEEGEKLANEVYALSTQLQALQKAMNEVQRQTSRQGTQIDQLNQLTQQVETLDRARRNSADLGERIEEVRQEIARLKGDFAASTEGFQQALTQMRDQAAEERTQTEEEKRQAAEEARVREQLMGNPEALIDEVVRLINGQQAERARDYLREFLARHKGDKRMRRWEDDAQYLIGETFYLAGDYKRAATEFNTVRKSYPKSPKVPDALLKMGLCFEQLKLPKDAKLFYETVIKQFPRSRAAKVAKKRLKQLKR